MDEDVEFPVIHPLQPPVLDHRVREVVILAAHESVDLVKLHPEAAGQASLLQVLAD